MAAETEEVVECRRGGRDGAGFLRVEEKVCDVRFALRAEYRLFLTASMEVSSHLTSHTHTESCCLCVCVCVSVCVCACAVTVLDMLFLESVCDFRLICE